MAKIRAVHSRKHSGNPTEKREVCKQAAVEQKNEKIRQKSESILQKPIHRARENEKSFLCVFGAEKHGEFCEKRKNRKSSDFGKKRRRNIADNEFPSASALIVAVKLCPEYYILFPLFSGGLGLPALR